MLNIENNPQKDVRRTNLQCDISDFALTKVNYVNFSSQKRGGKVVCLGTSLHCFLDATGRPVAIEDRFPEFHQWLLKLMD